MDRPVSGKDCKKVADAEETDAFPNAPASTSGPHEGPTTEATDAVIVKERLAGGSHDAVRCGLCGGGNDGEPPRELWPDPNAKYSLAPLEQYKPHATPQKSANDDESQVEEDETELKDGPGWLGPLLGPLSERIGVAGVWVHRRCAIWSPEVYFKGSRMKNVVSAIRRGRMLKCSRCDRPGATIGCRIDRCPRSYHLPCARFEGCHFEFHPTYLLACRVHLKVFRRRRRLELSRQRTWWAAAAASKKKNAAHHRMSKEESLDPEHAAAEQRRAEARAALRRDLEADNREMDLAMDENDFMQKERMRLHRDLERLAPLRLGGRPQDINNGKAASKPPPPMQGGGFDLPAGWESVGGLQEVIRCLKEMVLLPLAYPDAFEHMKIDLPRGVLLHGYPGTGKTLVARALAGACARGPRQVAFFARKGADCLGKYVGDAERQLRLLFQLAEQSQPSIIFFDEMDGLAPSRFGRQEDQTHSSVVSTLLALMDGVSARGSIIVIGATNRPDSLDPALRRPGRFDREVFFPLPSAGDREAILAVHTRAWNPRPQKQLLRALAEGTPGFAGADLAALCTAACTVALRRARPMAQLLLAPVAEQKEAPAPPAPGAAAAAAAAEGDDAAAGPALLPFKDVVVTAADWASALHRASPPCSRRSALAAMAESPAAPLPFHLAPVLAPAVAQLLLTLHRDGRVRFPKPQVRDALQRFEEGELLLVSSSSEKKKWQQRRRSANAGGGQQHGTAGVAEPETLNPMKIMRAGEAERILKDCGLAAASPLQAMVAAAEHTSSGEGHGQDENGDNGAKPHGSSHDVVGACKGKDLAAVVVEECEEEEEEDEDVEETVVATSGGVSRLADMGEGRTGRSGCGFRALVAGSAGAGQLPAASALLYALSEGGACASSVRVLSLPTMVVAGGGVASTGLVQILAEARRLCPCVVFMPHIERWAIAAPAEAAAGADQSESAATLSSPLVSMEWQLLTQQANSMPLAVGITFVATCYCPVRELPLSVCEFFGAPAAAGPRQQTGQAGVATAAAAAAASSSSSFAAVPRDLAGGPWRRRWVGGVPSAVVELPALQLLLLSADAEAEATIEAVVGRAAEGVAASLMAQFLASPAVRRWWRGGGGSREAARAEEEGGRRGGEKRPREEVPVADGSILHAGPGSGSGSGDGDIYAKRQCTRAVHVSSSAATAAVATCSDGKEMGGACGDQGGGGTPCGGGADAAGGDGRRGGEAERDLRSAAAGNAEGPGMGDKAGREGEEVVASEQQQQQQQQHQHQQQQVGGEEEERVDDEGQAGVGAERLKQLGGGRLAAATRATSSVAMTVEQQELAAALRWCGMTLLSSRRLRRLRRFSRDICVPAFRGLRVGRAAKGGKGGEWGGGGGGGGSSSAGGGGGVMKGVGMPAAAAAASAVRLEERAGLHMLGALACAGGFRSGEELRAATQKLLREVQRRVDRGGARNSFVIRAEAAALADMVACWEFYMYRLKLAADASVAAGTENVEGTQELSQQRVGARSSAGKEDGEAPAHPVAPGGQSLGGGEGREQVDVYEDGVMGAGAGAGGSLSGAKERPGTMASGEESDGGQENEGRGGAHAHAHVGGTTARAMAMAGECREGLEVAATAAAGVEVSHDGMSPSAEEIMLDASAGVGQAKAADTMAMEGEGDYALLVTEEEEEAHAAGLVGVSTVSGSAGSAGSADSLALAPGITCGGQIKKKRKMLSVRDECVRAVVSLIYAILIADVRGHYASSSSCLTLDALEDVLQRKAVEAASLLSQKLADCRNSSSSGPEYSWGFAWKMGPGGDGACSCFESGKNGKEHLCLHPLRALLKQLGSFE